MINDLMLSEAAVSILKKNFKAEIGEDMLIVCDEPRIRIADALAVAASRIGVKAYIMLLSDNFRKTSDVTKPKLGTSIREAIESVDIIILCLANIPNELNFRRFFIRAIRKSPVRVAVMLGIDENSFLEICDSPKPEYVERIGNDVAILLANGRKTRVISPSGTDVTFSLYGWKIPPEISSGYVDQPSIWGNLPGAEVFVVPMTKTAEGKICIDLTIAPDHLLSAPLSFDVRKGVVDPASVKSQDEEAIKLITQTLNKKNGSFLSEFGIGLNTKILKAKGIILVDEKMYSTAHFSLGDNREFGGKTRSNVHYDMVFTKPTILIDDVPIMKEGVFVYTSKQMKNDYKDFEGLIDSNVLLKGSPWANCVRFNGQLAKIWRGGANRVHAYRLGNHKTSMLAEKIWSAIKYSGSTPTELSEYLKIDLETVKKVVELLVYNQVISLFSKDDSESVEKLGQKAKQVELL
ncbi:MAG: hypothetical protein ABR909_10600 [Candidatus Bathyarchaeia archaeon]|jgi:hypothetical protein